MTGTPAIRFPYCSSCGRRHERRDCAEHPKGADAWRRVLEARTKSASPIHTSLTAGHA